MERERWRRLQTGRTLELAVTNMLTIKMKALKEGLRGWKDQETWVSSKRSQISPKILYHYTAFFRSYESRLSFPYD